MQTSTLELRATHPAPLLRHSRSVIPISPETIRMWRSIADKSFEALYRALDPSVVGMMPPLGQRVGGLPDSLPLSAADPLYGIVSQSTREFQRRRSVPLTFFSALAPQHAGCRLSAIDFTNTVPDAFPGFAFGFPANTVMPGAFLPSTPRRFPSRASWPCLPSRILACSPRGFVAIDPFSKLDGAEGMRPLEHA